MASHEDIEFSKLGSFRKYLSDDSIYRNNVNSRKFPPDKMSFLAATPYLMTLIICILFSTTFYNKDSIQNYKFHDPVKKNSYLQVSMNIAENFFFTFAINNHYMFYYKSPSVAEDHFDDSETYVLSHTFDKLLKYSYQCLCEIQLFQSFNITPRCPVHVVTFKYWTSDLDLLNPPTRSPLTQLTSSDIHTTVIGEQMIPISYFTSQCFPGHVNIKIVISTQLVDNSCSILS